MLIPKYKQNEIDKAKEVRDIMKPLWKLSCEKLEDSINNSIFMEHSDDKFIHNIYGDCEEVHQAFGKLYEDLTEIINGVNYIEEKQV